MVMRLQGTAALTRQLLALKNQGTDVKILRAIVKAGIQPAYERAKATIPVGTVPHKTYKGHTVEPGFAKSTLHVATHQRSDKGAVFASLGVEGEAYYVVVFIELGTSKMAARPWLRPALMNTSDAQLQILITKFAGMVHDAVASAGDANAA